MIFFDDLGAGYVTRHEVRSELYSVEGQIKRFGQRADEEGLGQTWDSNQEHMTTRQQAHDDMANHIILADNDFGDFRAKPLVGFYQCPESGRIRGISFGLHTGFSCDESVALGKYG